MSQNNDKAQIKERATSFLFSLLLENPDRRVGDVLDAFREVIGESGPTTPGKRRGRPPGSKSAPKAAAPAAAAPAAAPAAKPIASVLPAEYDVRTQAGRETFDALVLRAITELGGKDVRAVKIRKHIGGTAHQIRTSLNRLIGRDKVTYAGQASATKYTLS